MGIASLPCFLGDVDPLLIRVPNSPTVHLGQVWLLTHADTRRTRWVRLLCDLVRSTMRSFAARLEGWLPG